MPDTGDEEAVLTMLTLRGHHLLCMLTHIGKGYTPGFTANMIRVVEAIGAGEAFTIVAGPDVICQRWIDECGPGGVHCFKADLAAKDEDALATVSQVLGRLFVTGTVTSLSPAEIGRLREMFARNQQTLLACQDCQWNSLCADVAASGFAGCVM